MADMNDIFKKLGIAGPESIPSPLMSPTDARPEDSEYAPSPEDDMPASEDDEDDEFVDVQPMRKGTPLMSKADIAKIQAIPLPAGQQSQRSPAQMPAQTAPTLPTETNQEFVSATPSDDSTSKIRDLLSQYQKTRNGNQMNLNMLRGANQIAQGFAMGSGAKIGDGSEAVNALEKQLDQPEKDYAARIEDEANQPTSDISKFAREQAVNVMAKMNPSIDRSVYLKRFEHMSAKQLEKLGFKGVGSGMMGRQGFTTIRGLMTASGHPINQINSSGEYQDGITGKILTPDDKIINQVARLDKETDTYMNTAPGALPMMGSGPRAAVAPTGQASTIVDPATGESKEQKEYTLDDLNHAQIKNYDKVVVPILKDLKKDTSVKFATEINNAATNMLTKLEPLKPGDKMDSGVAEALAAQYARMATGAAPAEGTISHLRGSGGFMNTLGRAYNNIVKGEMSEADLDFFKSAALKFSKAAKQDAADAAQKYVDTVKAAYPSLNLTDENVRKMLATENLVKNTTVEKALQKEGLNKSNSKVPADSVRFRSSDGQIVTIPKSKLDAARKLDPKLQVLE